MEGTAKKGEDVPLHHFPSSQGLDAGAQFLPSRWGDFIAAVLQASALIDQRRAIRQDRPTSDSQQAQMRPNVAKS